jgi:1-acyl-sn-glycerol-3-phosphate acyltransferase
MGGFLALTVPLMPVQWLLLKTSRRFARTFPHWYHRRVCALLGVRLHVTGAIAHDRPVLVVANHVSWLDITVLSAVAPVSFVAKREVARWPLAGQLARLQRTIFVDRERRSSVGATAAEIGRRLAAGDAIVLFPEGTSSDGNRVLPFRSSLLAFLDGRPDGGGPARARRMPDPAVAPVVQTLALAYTRRDGIPLTWADRRALGYYGDVGMGNSAWTTLGGGSLEARIVIGPPRPFTDFPDRKALARHAEAEIRATVTALLRGRTG